MEDLQAPHTVVYCNYEQEQPLLDKDEEEQDDGSKFASIAPLSKVLTCSNSSGSASTTLPSTLAPPIPEIIFCNMSANTTTTNGTKANMTMKPVVITKAPEVKELLQSFDNEETFQRRA